MKTKSLISALILFAAVPAFAELTTDDTTSADYLKNHGHSDDTVWGVRKSIATINGEELQKPIEDERYNLPVIKQIRWFFKYMDPALDGDTFMNNHNINASTRYSDL